MRSAAPARPTLAAILVAAAACGGLYGSVFLHLGLGFLSGRLSARVDRALVAAGYVVLAFAPALLFEDPGSPACDHDCPANLLLVRHDDGLATALTAVGAALYAGLFALVLARAARRWRRTGPFERLQLMPVYVASLLTFALVTAARAASARWRGGRRSSPPASCRSRSSAASCGATSPASTPSCTAGSRSCAPRGRGSSRPATPPAGGSSATCTTARSRGSSRSRSCCARPARSPTGRRCR